MRSFAFALTAAVLVAGCAGMPSSGTPPAAAEDAARDADAPPPHANMRCGEGKAVVGFDKEGLPVCAPFVEPKGMYVVRQETGKSTEPEPRPALRVQNVFGSRPDAGAGIEEIRIMLELDRDAAPFDLETLVVVFTNASAHHEHLWASSERELEPGGAFRLEWVRGAASGTAGDSVLQQEDLVELRFALEAPLGPRETVDVELVALDASGPPAHAGFTTPPTFGDHPYIVLR